MKKKLFKIPVFKNNLTMPCPSCKNKKLKFKGVGGQYQYTWVSTSCQGCGVVWVFECEAYGSDFQNGLHDHKYPPINDNSLCN